MADIPPQPPPSIQSAAPTPPSPSPTLTAEQVQGIVADRFRDLFQFASTQISESRTTFERFYRNTLGSIVLLATAGVAVFLYLVGQQRKDIDQIVSNQATAHFEQLDQELRKKVSDRIGDEFSNESMQKMIRTTAQEEIKKGLHNEVSDMRRDFDALRADLVRYTLPRTLTSKQRTDLSAYFSHIGRESLTVKADISDGEALSFANQLVAVLREGNWDSKIEQLQPSIGVPGLTIRVETPGQGIPAEGHPSEVALAKGFREAQVEFGSVISFNQPTYSVSLIVGKRPFEVHNPALTFKK